MDNNDLNATKANPNNDDSDRTAAGTEKGHKINVNNEPPE